MIHELERVALPVVLPKHHLEAGDVGTVVDITSDGKTVAVVPAALSRIRWFSGQEIIQVRMPTV